MNDTYGVARWREVAGRWWTCDQQVAGSTPGAALSGATLGKSFTHVFLHTFLEYLST